MGTTTMRGISLRNLAVEREVHLSDDQIDHIAKQYGDRAREHIAGMGALMDLASAIGWDLTETGAGARLDNADGDYDQASRCLQGDLRDAAREERIRGREFNRLEKKLRATEARSRHAAFMARVDSGSLGWQVSLLLVAAEDAGLDHRGYRQRVTKAVDSEIDRRFPVRDSTVTVRTEGSRHRGLVERATEEENAVRDDLLTRKEDLAHRINALHSPKLTRAVVSEMGRLRRELTNRVTDGWRPDPERFETEVVVAAAAAAQMAMRSAA